jgi:hypothetical protein
MSSYRYHHHARAATRNVWPALDSWQVQLTKGNVRIGDVEREEAARALGEHFATGRLDREEYDERLASAFAAKTWGDLAPVFRDLPHPAPMVPSPVPRPADLAGRRHYGPPFLPVFMLLIGLALLFGHAWVFWLGLAAFLLWRRTRRPRYRGSYSSGSWRAPRGSWS